MHVHELQDPEKALSIWVKNLNNVVDKVSNTKPSMIEMKPKDTIKLDIDELDQPETYLEENILPEEGLQRYLYCPDEKHEGLKRQASDFIWSNNTYKLDQIVEDLYNYVLYYLQHGPGRVFVREELIYISQDTQVLPEWVRN